MKRLILSLAFVACSAQAQEMGKQTPEICSPPGVSPGHCPPVDLPEPGTLLLIAPALVWLWKKRK